MPKKVDEPQKKVEQENEKRKDFPVRYGKVGYTWFACNSCKGKKRTENKFKVHTNTIHTSFRKIIPQDISKRPIQC